MHQTCRLVAIALCGLIAFPVTGCAEPTSAPATAKDISQTLDAFVAGKTGVGVAVGVIDRGVVRTYTAGSLGVGAPPLDSRTEFQIGSVTKTFTATLLAAMVRSGEVKLDDPIQRYLPSSVKAPAFRGQAITLQNLAEQNSGLPALPTNFGENQDPYSQYTQAQLYSFLSGYTLARAPGAEYEYSNLGVGLLGDLLATREHTTYAALVQQRVIDPLGLKSTSVTPSADMLARLAPGRDPFGGSTSTWHFNELAACGAIYSDLDDMLRYVQANLAAPRGTLGADMAFAQQPRAPAAGMRIGLVWMSLDRLGIIWHNGAVGGYHSFIGFNRSAGTAVVVLVNSGDLTADTIGFHILAPSAVPAPVASPRAAEDAAITARVKTLYNSYLSGNVDTSQMTQDFAKLFTPAFIAQLRSGTHAPETWAFVSSVPDGGVTRYDYRLTFASGTATFSVWITSDGKIAGSRLS